MNADSKVVLIGSSIAFPTIYFIMQFTVPFFSSMKLPLIADIMIQYSIFIGIYIGILCLFDQIILNKTNKISIKNCEKCNDKAIFFHHKNNDYKDNRLENIESLCRNCFDMEVKGDTVEK